MTLRHPPTVKVWPFYTVTLQSTSQCLKPMIRNRRRHFLNLTYNKDRIFRISYLVNLIRLKLAQSAMAHEAASKKHLAFYSNTIDIFQFPWYWSILSMDKNWHWKNQKENLFLTNQSKVLSLSILFDCRDIHAYRMLYIIEERGKINLQSLSVRETFETEK